MGNISTLTPPTPAPTLPTASDEDCNEDLKGDDKDEAKQYLPLPTPVVVSSMDP
jgi:hypothetical protein